MDVVWNPDRLDLSDGVADSPGQPRLHFVVAGRFSLLEFGPRDTG